MLLGAWNRVEASSVRLIQQFSRSQAPHEMQRAANSFEARFGIKFDTLTYFPKAAFDALHSSGQLGRMVTVASTTTPAIRTHVDTLGRIANNPSATRIDRSNYFSALREIYQRLTKKPNEVVTDKGTLVVAPEREGRILAQSLGCLPAGRSLKPHAKRIAFEGGLLVGSAGAAAVKPYARCVLIDGAIASGATLMALVKQLKPRTSSFHVFTAHSAAAGRRALVRFAETLDVNLDVNVGDVGGELNSKFYAMDPTDRYVVGDLGDHISDL